MTATYHPPTGLVAFDAPTLAAVLDHARGRRVDLATQRLLVDAGVLVAGQLDPPLHTTVGPLLADGPRIRLLSRARGRLTITDAAFGPWTSDEPNHPGGARGATVVVRPPDATVLHVRHARAGAITRALAATVGLGPHVLGEPPLGKPLDLRDWATVRAGFDSATPSGWVGRRDQAELHEVRWAPTPDAGATTALVVARLDGGLAEIRPRPTDDGAFTVTSADTPSIWRRLCALTTGSGAAGRLPTRQTRASTGSPPEPTPLTPSS